MRSHRRGTPRATAAPGGRRNLVADRGGAVHGVRVAHPSSCREKLRAVRPAGRAARIVRRSAKERDADLGLRFDGRAADSRSGCDGAARGRRHKCARKFRGTRLARGELGVLETRGRIRDDVGMTPAQRDRRLARDREYQRVKYATDPAARERKRVRNAARSATVEGRSKRWEENQRRTRRVRAQRIAEHDAAV